MDILDNIKRIRYLRLNKQEKFLVDFLEKCQVKTTNKHIGYKFYLYDDKVAFVYNANDKLWCHGDIRIEMDNTGGVPLHDDSYSYDGLHHTLCNYINDFYNLNVGMGNVIFVYGRHNYYESDNDVDFFDIEFVNNIEWNEST